MTSHNALLPFTAGGAAGPLFWCSVWSACGNGVPPRWGVLRDMGAEAIVAPRGSQAGQLQHPVAMAPDHRRPQFNMSRVDNGQHRKARHNILALRHFW
jgi:hypothetical protein